VSIPWILTLLVCSITLFLVGVLNAVVSFRTNVPDVFGFVSTLTRGSPYVDIPYGGTTLDGIERAKLLQVLRVQLADVKEDAPIGYIALKSLRENDDGKASRVRKGRKYD
jgi:hypothetical protein